MSTRVSAPLLVLVAIVSVQFGATFAATLVPQVGAAGTTLLRLLFASILIVGLVRPRLRRRTRADWVSVLVFGIVLGAMNLSFYASLAHLPLGVAVTVEFIGPLGLAIATSRSVRDIAAAAVAGAGLILISEARSVPFADLPWVGLALAALAGLCWAGYILAARRVGASFEGLDGIAIAMVVAMIFVAPAGALSVGSWTWPIIAAALGIAVLSSLIPYSLELVALRRMTPGVFGILMSLEPAVAALGAFLVLHQRLSGEQLVGMVLVVMASVLVLGRRRRPDAVGPAQD